jgi:hypothetical protein
LNGANTDAVIANELNANGVPMQGEIGVSTTVPPARHPRVVSSRLTKTWNASWSARTFSALGNQVVQSTASGGGSVPTSTPVPPPPAPTSPVPRMNVDLPANGSRVLSTSFAVAGWAIDAASTTSPGVNAIDVWAFPVTGAPAIYVGSAKYGTSRPDVGAAFGSSVFTPSGFGLNGAIAPGTYDLAVFARTTATGVFDNVQVVRITVEAPPSNPRMWVDYPGQGDTVSQNIFVAGWAIDLSAGANSTGVDDIHVWAYPTTGAPPIFVGFGQMGLSRPDVAAAFGSAKYGTSGFTVRGTLPVNNYTLVVYAHSAVANSFNNVFTVSIYVR